METVSNTLNIPKEKIIVHKTKTSGVFSKGLWRTSVVSTQVALASFLTSKPVKLVLTQEEQDSYMAPGVDTQLTYKTAVSKVFEAVKMLEGVA
jgi:CO/xanthine dehydrogenase Mo-binding subunit